MKMIKQTMKTNLLFWATGILLVALSTSAQAQAKITTLTASHEERVQPICETETVSSKYSKCAPYTTPPELCQPRKFSASGRVLKTELYVEKKWQCVSRTVNDTFVQVIPRNLRNFGYKYKGKEVWGFPGPLFRLRRDSMNDPVPEYRFPGEKFKMTLNNNLPNEGVTVESQKKCTNLGSRFEKDIAPNCYHGDETTNFHYHGFHISPQFHQDYVLLKLFPKGTKGVPDYTSLSPEEQKTVSMTAGSYDYDLAPLPPNQTEGTHWYHPHKHGSTALQVADGMAGPFIIEGPFDYWLNDYYGYYDKDKEKPKLKDHLLVVQKFNDPIFPPTQPLINGQMRPYVVIEEGETQRWRFLSATMNSNSKVKIDFGSPECLQIKQIAMDGIQFGKDNYEEQSLVNPKDLTLTLHPGNRADFLARVPSPLSPECLSEGSMAITFSKGKKNQAQTALLRQNGTLFSVRVRSGKLDMKELPTKKEWPKLPGFLTPPTNPENKMERVLYQQRGENGRIPAPEFFIDEKGSIQKRNLAGYDRPPKRNNGDK